MSEKTGSNTNPEDLIVKESWDQIAKDVTYILHTISERFCEGRDYKPSIFSAAADRLAQQLAPLKDAAHTDVQNALAVINNPARLDPSTELQLSQWESRVQLCFKHMIDALPELRERYRTPEEARDHGYAMHWTAPRIEKLHQQGQISWFFDLDGTLVKATPGVQDDVDHDVELEALLNELYDQSGDSLAVITGRPDIFVSLLMPQGKFPVGTEHGSVIRKEATDVPVVRPGGIDISDWREDVIRRLAHIEGCDVEDYKVATLTAQFTQAANPESIRGEINRVLVDVANEINGHHGTSVIRVLDSGVPGNYVVELLPPTADKAEAIRFFMEQEAFKGKTPVMCGDSAGDETAMKLAKDLGGYALGVGPKAPKWSDINFTSIDELRGFLNDISKKTVAPAPSAPRPS